jgi:hypothetical protein
VHIELVSVASGKALGTHDFVTVQGASAEAFAADARVLTRKLIAAMFPNRGVAPVAEQPPAIRSTPPEATPAEPLPPPPPPPVVAQAETAQPSPTGIEQRPLRFAARVEGEILGRTWSPSVGVGYSLAARWELAVMLVPLPATPTGLGVRPGVSFMLLEPGIRIQPYLGAGLSAFFMTDSTLGTNVGVWGAAGVEVRATSYFSISAEAPVEFYFLRPAKQRNVFIPLAAGLNLRL